VCLRFRGHFNSYYTNGTAEILASIKSELKGTVKFIFQPAEEGAPEGEEVAPN
jgi:metal-dependent amidase/aminoacylase/carboxypeptidase family protein